MTDGSQPVRLYCFAHAGAGVSSFHGWGAHLGSGTEPAPVQLPGRGSLRDQPRLTDRDALLRRLLPALTAAAETGPYALYGHSLGGLVAYTLAAALRRAGVRPPVLVAVGGCLPPDLPSPLIDAAAIPDHELFMLLTDLGAEPAGSAAQPGGLWYRRVLPVLRDDLRLAVDLRAAAGDPALGGPLDVPVLAIGAEQDELVGAVEMRAWQRWTTAPCETRTVAGDHFFVRGAEAPRLVGEVCRALSAAASASASASASVEQAAGESEGESASDLLLQGALERAEW